MNSSSKPFFDYSPLAHLYANNATTAQKAPIQISDDRIIQRSLMVQSSSIDQQKRNSFGNRDNEETEVRSFIISNGLSPSPFYQSPLQSSISSFSTNETFSSSFNDQSFIKSNSLSPLEPPSVIKSSIERFDQKTYRNDFSSPSFISAPSIDNKSMLSESSLYSQLNGLSISSTSSNQPIPPDTLPSPPSYIESCSSFLCICPLSFLLQSLLSVFSSLSIDWHWKSKGSFKCVYYEKTSCESVAFKIKFYQWKSNTLNNARSILIEFQRRFGSCVPFNHMLGLINTLLEEKIQVISYEEGKNQNQWNDKIKQYTDRTDQRNQRGVDDYRPSRSRSRCRDRSLSPVMSNRKEGERLSPLRNLHRSNRHSNSKERFHSSSHDNTGENIEQQIEGKRSKLPPPPPLRSSLAPPPLISAHSTFEFAMESPNELNPSVDIATLQILLAMSDLRYNGDVCSTIALLASFASLKSNAELMCSSFADPIKRLLIDALSSNDAHTARSAAHLLANLCKIPKGVTLIDGELMDSVLKSFGANNDNNDNDEGNDAELYAREIRRQLSEAIALIALTNASALLSLCSTSALRFSALRSALTKRCDDQKLNAAVESAAQALKI